MRSTFASIRSARRLRWTARPVAPSAAQAGKRLDGGADRQGGDLGVAARDLGEQLPVERRVVLERLGARNAAAADEVVDRDVGVGDAHAGVLPGKQRHQSDVRRSPSADWSSTEYANVNR